MAPCNYEFQFDEIFVGTTQRRILFPHAPSDSTIGAVIGHPDKVQTQLRVSAGEIAFEFWIKDPQAHGVMTIERPSGRFAFSWQANREIHDAMVGLCQQRPPPRRDTLSRPHVPDLN
jgi:hypothetical protein